MNYMLPCFLYPAYLLIRLRLYNYKVYNFYVRVQNIGVFTRGKNYFIASCYRNETLQRPQFIAAAVALISSRCCKVNAQQSAQSAEMICCPDKSFSFSSLARFRVG